MEKFKKLTRSEMRNIAGGDCNASIQGTGFCTIGCGFVDGVVVTSYQSFDCSDDCHSYCPGTFEQTCSC